MKAKTNHILRALFVMLAVMLAVPALAQNTRGDRPVNNSGKIRQTQGKSIKKKGKATTKDIAGRRLRTKNKSSANRANVGIPQPSTARRQPRHQKDNAARVPSNNGQIISRLRRKQDPDRSWNGDISGYRQRKIKPSSAREEARRVYPQGKFATRHPRPQQRPFKGYENKTASGKVIVKRTPQRAERAWKGDLRGQPFYPPSSKTGSVGNVYRRPMKQAKFISKNPSPRDRAFSNRDAISRARMMGTPTGAKNWGRRGPLNIIGQGPFVTRGKKNVYWGKVRISERAKTRDIAGKPLARRNFRSTGIGVTGRDTLGFFGRRPHGDLAGEQRRKYLRSTGEKGGWIGDIAGYRLRKKTPGRKERSGTEEFSGFLPFKKLSHNKPLVSATPGIGAGAIAKGLRKTKGNGQGGKFAGFFRSKPTGTGGGYRGNARGALWNNNGTPVEGKLLPGNAGLAGRFSGRQQRYGKNFIDRAEDYRGFLKTKGKDGKFIGSFGHRLWNNHGTAVEGKLLSGNGGLAGRFSGNIKREKIYTDKAEDYRGFLKTKGKDGKFIGSFGHRLWNNNGTPVEGKLLSGNGGLAGRFSGNIKREKIYTDKAEDYRGFLKTKGKDGKFIGSFGHRLWNNNGESVTALETTKFGAMAGNYHGNLKAQRKGRFIGSFGHQLWNNSGKSVTELETTKFGALAGNYHGNIKEQKRGKFIATPSRMWNNHGKAVTDIDVSKGGAAAGLYGGNTKVKEKGKHIAVPDKLWNNDGKATTQIRLTNAGAQAGNFQGKIKYQKTKESNSAIEGKLRMKQDYVRNPYSVDLAIKKQRPDNMQAGNFEGRTKYHKTKESNSAIEGRLRMKQDYVSNPYAVDLAIKKQRPVNMQAGNFQGKTKYHKAKENDSDIESRLKMKQNYVQNPHSVDLAIRKQKPELNYKAGNFSSGAKVIGRRSHSPNSVDGAIDMYHSQASARRIDYQGNIKMRKFVDHRQSPDAKFINTGENNVKEDRTIMTNVKLFWAKVFQKSDSQPSNLKERSNKLRYDKGEKGLWAD